MSEFFSLGGGKEQGQDQQTDNNNSLFLFKNEEIYNKGFELWQQYNQLHQQRLVSHQQHHSIQDVHFSIGPSNLGDEPSDYSYGSAAGFRVMMNQGRGKNDVGVNCQDCGNQAKKDCVHMRCRTCCKSRGFPCQTHVKSTWVPAAKRREKQQQPQPGSNLQQDQQQLAVGGENPKRLRENYPGGGFRELGRHLPPEVNSPAFFRCVKVSATDDAEEHFAYQTAVNIGGHVFKEFSTIKALKASTVVAGRAPPPAQDHHNSRMISLPPLPTRPPRCLTLQFIPLISAVSWRVRNSSHHQGLKK
ncbi:UNVERIFIED_CONTAM: protein SHORT INTERNODES [Sesamum calycinum]|uniref:Protein SHORT INTERNODES n=1 Tax=Sesamum calycinum TaxID=2727403 RepID=A0AAW2QNT0_9LAMI